MDPHGLAVIDVTAGCLSALNPGEGNKFLFTMYLDSSSPLFLLNTLVLEVYEQLSLASMEGLFCLTSWSSRSPLPSAPWPWGGLSPPSSCSSHIVFCLIGLDGLPLSVYLNSLKTHPHLLLTTLGWALNVLFYISACTVICIQTGRFVIGCQQKLSFKHSGFWLFFAVFVYSTALNIEKVFDVCYSTEYFGESL